MTSWFIGPDPLWRLMATEISRKTTGFSYLSAFIISHTSTKHISRPAQSLGYTKRHILIPFPCSSCMSLLLYNIIGSLSSSCSKSSTDLHEAFRYPPNHQDLHENRETFWHWPVSYHTWAKMMCSNNDWAAIVPIFPDMCKFEIPERQKGPSKRCNTT